MKKTTLEKQIDLINDQFDEMEKELRQKRKESIEAVWRKNIETGLLKSELQ